MKRLLPALILLLVFATSLVASASTSIIPRPSNNLGLVGLWTFDGSQTNWTTDTTNDSSGQSNNGRMINMSTSSSVAVGKLGQSLLFNGSAGYVDIPFNSSLALTTGGFSVSAWVYLNATTYQSLVYHGLGCSQWGDWMLSVGGSENNDHLGHYTFLFSNTSNTAATNTAISTNLATTGSWVHLVGVYDGSAQTSLYINGVLNNTASASGHPFGNGMDVYIGADAGCGGRFFTNGRVDDVRVYNRALSATEIAALYKSGAAHVGASSAALTDGTSLTNGLVGLWTFDGSNINWGTGLVNDSSGQGNTGSLINMSTSTSITQGKLGQALNFDGSSSYVYAGTGGSLSGTMTACAWIFPTSLLSNGNERTIIDRENGTSNEQYQLFADNSYLGFGWGNVLNAGLQSVNQVLATSTWQHVCASRNAAANAGHLYVNGSEVASTFQAGTAPGTPSGAALYIGNETPAAGCGAFCVWSGKIDDARIYNRELTAAEVKQLYNLGTVTIRNSACGLGGNITFTKINGGKCIGFLTSTATSTWTVPSNWNNSNNTIEAIGGGGAGAFNASGAGGGGEYRKISNFSSSPLASIAYRVGAGAPGATACVLAMSGSSTVFVDSNTLIAVGGGGGDCVSDNGGTGGTGGTGAAAHFNGGSGGTFGAIGGGGGTGGGGAGGPNGIGGNGGADNAGTAKGGAGGGGNGGGTAGTDASGNNGSNGGDNSSGTGHGIGGTSGVDNATAGTNGGGGGGGANGGEPGKSGGTGTEWDATHGSGGGGGGGGLISSGTAGNGGNGALYGGGGASGGGIGTTGTAGNGGNGAQGIIVITYTPKF